MNAYVVIWQDDIETWYLDKVFLDEEAAKRYCSKDKKLGYEEVELVGSARQISFKTIVG